MAKNYKIATNTSLGVVKGSENEIDKVHMVETGEMKVNQISTDNLTQSSDFLLVLGDIKEEDK